MTYNEDAHRLEDVISEIPGVRYVALQSCGPGQLAVGVVLETYDYDVRSRIIEVIDDFHRAHVQDLSVDLDIVDVEHAAHLFTHA
jgi:hypothetical protein